MTVGMGATAGGSGSAGGDGNLAYATGNSDSDFIGRQTSIIGVSGVNVYTGDNTHIKGAIIAALNGNLTLNTGTLSFEDMTGKRTSSSRSMGISASWKPESSSASSGDSRPQTDSSSGSSQNWLQNLVDRQEALDKQWKAFKNDIIFAPGAFTYGNSETSQTARATVGQGTIIVRDNPDMDLSGLNRDTSKALTEETIRNTNFTIDPLFGYVDRAFGYSGAALSVPEKIDEGKKFLDNPGGFIKEKWDILLALLSRTGAPPVARAATVDYSSGTSYFVIGNPTSSGGAIGIGGTSVLPADNANASGNSVNVTDGTVNTGIYGGHHKATTGSAGADSNRVTISNFAGGSALLIWGGDADASEYVAGNTSSASGNSVTVSGGTFGSVHGGNSQSYNGPASADGNTVRVTGVTVDDISGGLAMVNMGGSTATATSNNNEVIVTDSAVTYSVYGGSVVYDSARSFVSNGNRITLSGNTSVGGGVYGGALLHDTNNYNGSTGNTLNIVNPGSGGITVSGGVKYFQHYNFYLPSSMTAGGTMLRVGGTACVNGATVNVGIDGASSPLRAGDTVTLIDAGTLDGTPANSTADGQGMQGVTLRYQFDISTAANRLLATVSGAPAVNEQTKALSEGYLSGMALVNQGADLIAGQGMDSAVKAARSGSERGYGLATFGALSGGSLRYNTGSHVDVRSLSLLTGLSFGAELAPGRMTLGAFFEYGNGSYDTYNSFSNAASVHGDGNMYHIGGGVLGRMDFADTGPGHFYAEASGRMGNAHNEYDSSDLRDARGRKADYDSSFAYYGLHFGTGYVWNINDRASLDLYGKYFWTRQEGDSLRLSTGDPVRFKASDSNRLRFGSRFGYAVNEYLSPYIGAAWEHEFDGKARATTNGHDIDAPSLRGDTGMGELGLTLTPSSSLPLVFDLGVQGYVGKREGVTGSLQVRFDF